LNKTIVLYVVIYEKECGNEIVGWGADK
jgi:hypothetical protein